MAALWINISISGRRRDDMFVVKKKKGESEDRLIARFRKKTLNEGILLELRDRERYKKPAQKRKEKKYRIEYLRELEKKRNY
jgi:ribosomal protein S21